MQHNGDIGLERDNLIEQDIQGMQRVIAAAAGIIRVYFDSQFSPQQFPGQVRETILFIDEAAFRINPGWRIAWRA